MQDDGASNAIAVKAYVTCDRRGFSLFATDGKRVEAKLADRTEENGSND